MKDYYIALGLIFKGQYAFPMKKFYYTTSGAFNFELMPLPNEQSKEIVDLKDQMFFGDPEKILQDIKTEEQPGDAPPEENKDKEQKEEKKQDLNESVELKPKVIPKPFLERDRLSYVVNAIENDTHIIPEGAFKLLPIHELRRNEHFRGKILKNIY